MGLFISRVRFAAAPPSEAAVRAALVQQVGSSDGLDEFEIRDNVVQVTTALDPVTQPYAIKILLDAGGVHIDFATGRPCIAHLPDYVSKPWLAWPWWTRTRIHVLFQLGLLATALPNHGRSKAAALSDAETESALELEFRALSDAHVMAPLGQDATRAVTGPGGVEAAASTKYGGFLLGAQNVENYLLAAPAATDVLVAAVCQGNEKATSTMVAGALALSELYEVFSVALAPSELAPSIGRAFEAAGRRMARAASEVGGLQKWRFSSVAGRVNDLRGMATSLTAAVVKDGKLAVAHVGEGSAYLFRAGELVRVSADHLWRGQPEYDEKVREHPELADLHVVMHVLGLSQPPHVAIYEGELKPGDVLLLGSSLLAELSLKELLAEHSGTSAVELCRLLTEATPLEERAELSATYVVVKVPAQ